MTNMFIVSLSEILFDSDVKWHERIIGAIVTHFLSAFSSTMPE